MATKPVTARGAAGIKSPPPIVIIISWSRKRSFFTWTPAPVTCRRDNRLYMLSIAAA